ncbi:MAG: DUF167 domain-containing protein [Longispora sp.]|nr:DUF167 domain-containing protein [Longispora sp. (in: high G+C Gram-positive bacteria)]
MTLAVRVRPGASRTWVGGSFDGPLGPALVVAVSAPAVEGTATQAVVRAVAVALGVKSRDLSVRTGRTSRDKLLVIDVNSREISVRIRELLETC